MMLLDHNFIRQNQNYEKQQNAGKNSTGVEKLLQIIFKLVCNVGMYMHLRPGKSVKIHLNTFSMS